MGVAKYKIDLNFFNRDSEELWYLLGFIASDGYISDNRVELALNNKDRYMLETLNNLFQPTKRVYFKDSVDASVLQIDNKQLAKRFKKLFSMTSNKKQEEIHFPDIPDEYVRHFIRGVMDGDGCIDTTKGYRSDNVYVGPRLRILGNVPFLSALLDRVREFIPNKTYAVPRKQLENVWYITYNFSTARNVLDWLYNDSTIYLDRKYQKYLEVTGQQHENEDIVYTDSLLRLIDEVSKYLERDGI